VDGRDYLPGVLDPLTVSAQCFGQAGVISVKVGEPESIGGRGVIPGISAQHVVVEDDGQDRDLS